MEDFEWASDYAALCAPYSFSIVLGPHGKEMRANAPANPGQSLLVESPIVAWPVRASAAADAYTFCENCLKIRPFQKEQLSDSSNESHRCKVRLCGTSAPRNATDTEVLSTANAVQAEDGQQGEGTVLPQTQSEASEETGVCMHDGEGHTFWFCSSHCHQQAFGCPIPVGEATTDPFCMQSPSSRKRGMDGYLRATQSKPPSNSSSKNPSDVSSVRRVFGWQEFLSPEGLRTLRGKDQRRLNGSSGLPVEEDHENPVGLEALARVVARIAATTASLHAMGGWSLENAYAEACRPFLRLARAEATEAHSAFDLSIACLDLRAVLDMKISAVLGSDIATALLGIEGLAFLYGTLMRNAQSLLMWGATNEGSLMVLRAAGVYLLQACCNHSCIPNCSVENIEDASITLRAERPIAEGDELTISYVPLSLPQKKRQALLDSYRFTCDCARCVQERQQDQHQREYQ
ncbi:uncharacterized protein LOC34623874 [Cyclospora cayetanensis]|uniref:Uncharacterized protein LOC34623874 n=2 Tax=Cyclospora cayetanensis TaxID=88456 RepID=A0A6P5WEK3_9EIME|nr:uncharacterized protein LOC34623874 [Cyclospora cayetanensis]OEH79560.1 hypothetical protein cyc_08052 [Cyclospora cayetanensis]